MARAPNPKAKLAEQLYRKGYKLIDIAKELEVPDGTVRRWKHAYNWDKKRSEIRSERKRTKNNTKNKEIDELTVNDELTDKQKLFCIYYVKYFNTTKAYQKAYKCKYETAAVNGSRLLKNTKIATEIKKLKQNKLNRAFISQDDIFQKYLDIAFSDMKDFVEFGTKEVTMVSDDGKKGKIDITYTNVINSDEVDGTIISEISNSSKGVKVKLQDKMKALQWLSEHMNMFTEEQKARVDKLKVEKEILLVKKMKAEEDDW